VLAEKELFTMSSSSGVRDLICKSEVPATIPFGKSSALAALLQYDLVTAHFEDELLVLLISTVEQSCQECQIHKTQNPKPISAAGSCNNNNNNSELKKIQIAAKKKNSLLLHFSRKVLIIISSSSSSAACLPAAAITSLRTCNFHWAAVITNSVKLVSSSINPRSDVVVVPGKLEQIFPSLQLSATTQRKQNKRMYVNNSASLSPVQQQFLQCTQAAAAAATPMIKEEHN
jgi:hypothetical protein